MFEVGFSELLMVGLVSLLVIGPEKLPKVARIAGFWLGRTQRMVANFKAEIHQELQLEEMRQAFEEQVPVKEYQQLLDEVSAKAEDIKASIQQPLPVFSKEESAHEEPK